MQQEKRGDQSRARLGPAVQLREGAEAAGLVNRTSRGRRASLSAEEATTGKAAAEGLLQRPAQRSSGSGTLCPGAGEEVEGPFPFPSTSTRKR